jgi:hypothetical protein
MFNDLLIKMLIGFFLLLICYLMVDEIYNYNSHILEGLDNGGTYKEYDGDDPMILGQQNAGNIAALKSQMDDILALKQEVTDMRLNMIKMSGQLNDFASAQSDKSDETVGTEEPTITGATDEEDDSNDKEDE